MRPVSLFDLIIQLISSIIGVPFFEIPEDKNLYRFRMTDESIDYIKIGLYRKIWYGKLVTYIEAKKKEKEE